MPPLLQILHIRKQMLNIQRRNCLQTRAFVVSEVVLKLDNLSLGYLSYFVDDAAAKDAGMGGWVVFEELGTVNKDPASGVFGADPVVGR